MQKTNYDIIFFHGFDRIVSEEDENIDVEIKLDDGRRFAATFFTLANIKSIMDRRKKTGECQSGAYFWASGLIVVETLSEASIRACIDDLLETGALEYTFELL